MFSPQNSNKQTISKFTSAFATSSHTQKRYYDYKILPAANGAAAEVPV